MSKIDFFKIVCIKKTTKKLTFYIIVGNFFYLEEKVVTEKFLSKKNCRKINLGTFYVIHLYGTIG